MSNLRLLVDQEPFKNFVVGGGWWWVGGWVGGWVVESDFSVKLESQA